MSPKHNDGPVSRIFFSFSFQAQKLQFTWLYCHQTLVPHMESLLARRKCNSGNPVYSKGTPLVFLCCATGYEEYTHLPLMTVIDKLNYTPVLYIGKVARWIKCHRVHSFGTILVIPVQEWLNMKSTCTLDCKVSVMSVWTCELPGPCHAFVMSRTIFRRNSKKNAHSEPTHFISHATIMLCVQWHSNEGQTTSKLIRTNEPSVYV